MFFFKQKTAYEMRISDMSSDVCSSDLTDPARMEAVLATLYEAIADLAIVIQPIIPASAAALLEQMGIAEDGRSYAAIGSDWYARLRASGFTLNAPKPLFPRLELPVEEA